MALIDDMMSGHTWEQRQVLRIQKLARELIKNIAMKKGLRSIQICRDVDRAYEVAEDFYKPRDIDAGAVK